MRKPWCLVWPDQNPYAGTIALGYPLLHHYQHLPYLLPALLYFPLRTAIPLADVLHWINYLLLSLFPLSIYWSIRRFGFARLPSAWAGLLGRDLQLHRLIAGVHLGGIFLMGIGLALPWNWVLARRDVRAVLDVGTSSLHPGQRLGAGKGVFSLC